VQIATSNDDHHRDAVRAALAAAILATFAGSLTAVVAVVPVLVVGTILLSGTEVLIGWAIVAVVLIAFFAFNFRRLLRVELKKNDTSVNIDIGGPS
jgi:type IV secretory pathway VirB2 component (pilin)